ncbi:Protein of unknown function, DUF488 [Hoeflea sp. IMCC20628]|uniref:DUF488 domain-containing protein n=1 Tax=Hoeflea sp. IMCC20628 TaxID=1620421 RepID=UPI00063AC135|nr:DUF488 domain-containing protein [Hoeflea sp. IMCC20628]AKH98791.1 Protein of unknown function, DUF488 [Hoeflea sp. IMCC20628]
MATHFTTVGHSNRSLEDFLAILRQGQVGVIIDVRSFPRSRANPTFNIDTLPAELARVQIDYQHLGGLGGRRPKQPEVDENLNAMWRNRSFHNYAGYALSQEFAVAFRDLLRLGQDRRVALMCSEAVWWRCHRRIITDYLIVTGHDVEHLMTAGRIEPARLTPGARTTADGQVIYPAT